MLEPNGKAAARETNQQRSCSSLSHYGQRLHCGGKKRVLSGSGHDLETLSRGMSGMLCDLHDLKPWIVSVLMYIVCVTNATLMSRDFTACHARTIMATLTVHKDLYFPDGNIVLNVVEDNQTMRFCVHKSVLSRNSLFFADMFGIPQPPENHSQMVEGCPAINLTGDTIDDWTTILGALYNVYVSTL
jgi:hypothetical protein